MLKSVIIIISFSILIACSKTEEVTNCLASNCLEPAYKSNWYYEAYNGDYSIQFPTNYEGTGMVSFEGNIFSKKRTDSMVQMQYSFCNGLYCSDYGDTLPSQYPTSITAFDQQNNSVILNNTTEFCECNGITASILYYNSSNSSTGIYYKKTDSGFQESLSIFFDHTELNEVETILQTIKTNKTVN